MQIFSKKKAQELESKLEIGGKIYSNVWGLQISSYSLDVGRQKIRYKCGREIGRCYQLLFQDIPQYLGSLDTKARFTQGVRAKKLGANFEHLWVANWPQFTNECQNIEFRILISAGTLAPRVANWPPTFDGIPFPALGLIQGHKVQHLLVLRAD